MSTDADYPVSPGGSSPEVAPGSPGTAGASATYLLTAQAEAAAARAARSTIGDFLGFGVIRPFVRDRKLDWAADGGVRLVRAALGQILGTRAASDFTEGELPWRDEFGSLLHLLRHRANDETTRELARVYVAGAITRWEPRARVTGVTLRSETLPGEGPVIMAIRVQFDLIRRNVPGNQVLLPGLEVEVGLA